ncbi:hypothetical protein [Salmonella enterica]|uniref:hypothetical protein n=1 Tax=Salmonella enterica TaxID=28901 RepID=UPI000D57132A|nr:hypothetical protein [Salmonella enterica]PVO50889.1 hypothetical protein C4743_06110 [Salmonella enterica subsp. enterica serovar Newport]
MSKDTKHVLKIEAEVKQARNRLRELENQINDLADKAGKGIKVNAEVGSIGGIGEMISGLRGLGGAVGGLIAAPVAAIGSIKALTDHVTGLTKELRQTSNEIGLSVEQLQRMKGVVSGTGLTIEKLGDMHKDLSEKMGAAILEGGGVSDMIKAAGVDFRQLSGILKESGDATDVLARVFYTMKQGGRSLEEIRAVMEDLVSDGSKLIPTFEKLGSEQNYLNEKSQVSIDITSEMAKKHEEYERKTAKLGQSIDNLKVQTLSGVVDTLNHLLDGFAEFAKEIRKGKEYSAPKLKGEDAERRKNLLKHFDGAGRAFKNAVYLSKDAPMDKVAFNKLLDHGFHPQRYNANDVKNKEANALRMINDGYNPLDEEDRKNYRWKDKDGNSWDYFGNAIVNFGPKPSTTLGPDAGEGNSDKKTCSKCGKAEHEKGQKCPVDAAKDAQRLQDQIQKQRENSLKKLNALDVKLQGQTAASIASQNKQLEESLKDLDNGVKLGLISQQEAAEKRQALIDQNTENVYKMLLGADPIDALNALDKLQEIRDNELASHKRLLEDKLISLEEYHRRVNDTEQNYSQIGDVANGLSDHKMQQLTNGFDYQDPNDPFAKFNALNQEKADAEQTYKTKKLEIEGMNDPAKRYKALEKLNESHQKRMQAIEKQYADARQGVASDMYDGIAGAMALFGAENSKAAKAAFMAHQAYQIGEATVSTYAGAAAAIAKQDYGGAALIVAQGLAQVAKIKSVSIDGMAHDGIDNIPREGTWLLQKGERVVDDRTNGDLKEFLSNQKSGESSNAPVHVDASLHIAGNVNSSDKMVMEAIKRHPQFVAQAVQDANRRRM